MMDTKNRNQRGSRRVWTRKHGWLLESHTSTDAGPSTILDVQVLVLVFGREMSGDLENAEWRGMRSDVKEPMNQMTPFQLKGYYHGFSRRPELARRALGCDSR